MIRHVRFALSSLSLLLPCNILLDNTVISKFILNLFKSESFVDKLIVTFYEIVVRKVTDTGIQTKELVSNN
ncbi:hypothetical protein ACH3XW_38675 [Acanthocheilonema viteae]